MGDLNAGEDSEPLSVFLGLGYRSAFPMLHPETELGTFNGFRDPTGGRRIDHILLDSRIEPRRAEIVNDSVNGIWPSDHFPVVAVLSTMWQMAPGFADGHRGGAPGGDALLSQHVHRADVDDPASR